MFPNTFPDGKKRLHKLLNIFQEFKSLTLYTQLPVDYETVSAAVRILSFQMQLPVWTVDAFTDQPFR